MIRKITALFLMIVFCFLLSMNVVADEHPDRVVDMDLRLSDDEKSELEEHLDELSGKLDFDIVAVTVSDREGKSMQDYADDYFDYNGYGLGEDESGALMLLDMNSRDVYISTKGEGLYAFTDYGIERALDEITEYLKDSEYYAAFMAFADIADQYVSSYRDGRAVDIAGIDTGKLIYEVRKDSGLSEAMIIKIVISVLAGFGLCFIPTAAMKKKMKSVRSQAAAQAYLKKGSFNVYASEDRYLYHHVVVTPIPRNEGNNGGSSVHFSGSGGSHGGGGRHF